jgi:hypothetical protein
MILDKASKQTLKELVNNLGLSSVISLLTKICHDKVENINNGNWSYKNEEQIEFWKADAVELNKLNLNN